MIPGEIREVLLALSFFVVGMALYMVWRHAVALWRFRHTWDVWMLLIYAGLANTVGLVGEAIWGAPTVALTWRSASFALGLCSILAGMIGVAYSVGHHDKRATDKEAKA